MHIPKKVDVKWEPPCHKWLPFLILEVLFEHVVHVTTPLISTMFGRIKRHSYSMMREISQGRSLSGISWKKLLKKTITFYGPGLFVKMVRLMVSIGKSLLVYLPCILIVLSFTLSIIMIQMIQKAVDSLMTDSSIMIRDI